MSSSSTPLSLFSRIEQRAPHDPSQRLQLLCSAEAALQTLAENGGPNGAVARQTVESWRQVQEGFSPSIQAVHGAVLQALAQAEEGDSSSWSVELVERACTKLQEEIATLQAQDCAAVSVGSVEWRSSQRELLELLAIQRQFESLPEIGELSEPSGSDDSWILRSGPQGDLRQQGREWLASESGAHDHHDLWERLCDILFAHEKREFFSDDPAARRQQYAGFGKRLVALWEAYRKIEVSSASQFMETEEFNELLAGTCLTGWDSRLGHLEHMLQLAEEAAGARRSRLQQPPCADLFWSGAAVAAQWRQEVLRDRVLHRVAQLFSLHDERTGAVDAHVYPSLLQTCNEALVLGLPAWEREEIWVEQFRALLVDQGEPSEALSEWFGLEEDGEQALTGLFSALQQTFLSAPPQEQGALFECMLSSYQAERTLREDLEIPCTGYASLRTLEQQLEQALEEDTAQEMIRVLSHLSHRVGRPFFQRPSERAWQQLVQVCQTEAHIHLLNRLRILRHHHPDWDPRRILAEITSAETPHRPVSHDLTDSLNDPTVAPILMEWQQCADPEVWEEFTRTQVPLDALSTLQRIPDLIVRQQVETLHGLLIESRSQEDGTESIQLSRLGLRVWATLLGLLRLAPEESAPPYVQRLAHWINGLVHRPDSPLARLRQQQQEYAMALVQRDGLSLQHLPDQFRCQLSIVRAAVEQNGLAWRFARGESLRNRGIAIAAARQNPASLEWATSWLRGDRAVIRAAVQQDGLSLRWARPPASRDREIVREAVQQNGLALQYASEGLRSDPEIIRLAIDQNPEAQSFVL